MSAAEFESWLESYLAWKRRIAEVLGKPIPGEVTELIYEHQRLAAFRWEAEEHRSEALGHYYAAKHRVIEELSAHGVAKTALEGLAKAKAHRQLWARENAHGVAECVASRVFAVVAELGRLGVKGY